MIDRSLEASGALDGKAVNTRIWFDSISQARMCLIYDRKIYDLSNQCDSASSGEREIRGQPHLEQACEINM